MGGRADQLVDERLAELDHEILAGIPKQGHVFEQMNRSIGTDENNDSGSFHNTSLGTLSNQRKEMAKQNTSNPGEPDVSGHSSQDISMLSANKANSGEKTSNLPKAKRNVKDLDQKLLSLNDIMMQASQNKSKIDAEQEHKILERARAFCQGRDGRQIPQQESTPPMTF